MFFYFSIFYIFYTLSTLPNIFTISSISTISAFSHFSHFSTISICNAHYFSCSYRSAYRYFKHLFKKTFLLKNIIVCSFLTMLSIKAPVHASQNVELNTSEILTITANRTLEPTVSVLAPVIVITSEEIQQSQAQSVPELLKRLPGINLAESGGRGQQSSLFVRGTESRHVLILVDGIRLNQANISGSSDLSQIPLSIVQRIEYIRGARSAIYGSDAIGGVINLITQPEKREDSASKMSVMLGNHDSQAYQINSDHYLDQTRLYGAANFSRSQGTDAVANFPQAGSIRQEDKDGFKQYNIWMGAEHSLNQNWQVGTRAYAIKNHNQYDGFFSFIRPDALIDQRELESYTVDTRLDYQRDDYQSGLIMSINKTKDFNFNDAYGKYDISASIDDAEQINLQWLNRWQIGFGSINAGLDWQQQKTKRALLDSTENEQSRLTNTGLYLVAQQKLNDVTFEGAIREDDQSQFGKHFTWNVGIGYELSPNYRIALLAGTAYKAPNLMQLYSQYGGNTKLRPEESQQYELVLEGIHDLFSWKASAYQNEIKELIDYRHQQFINIGNAEMSGVELELTIPQERLSHRFTFAYLDAKDKNTGHRLLRRAQKQLDYQLEIPIKEVQLTVNYHLASERSDQIFDNDSFTNKTVILPVDQQIDVALSYPLTNNLSLRGKITDMFKQQRETVYGYRPSGRTFAVTIDYTF